jgi:DNA-binding response OmpR family regulator
VPEQSNRTASVLLLDRDPGSRRAFEDSLTAEGYRVLHAADAVRAIRLFDAEKPTVVLAAADTPNFGADVVISHVRSVAPEVSIIIVTSEHPEDAAQEQQRYRADRVLNKPLELREILAAVTGALEDVRRAPGQG